MKIYRISLIPILSIILCFSVRPARGQGLVKWAPRADHAFRLAYQTKKPLMLYFRDEDEQWCYTFEFYTFCNEAVAKKVMTEFVPVKVEKPKKGNFVREFDIRKYPTVLFLDSAGSEIDRIERAVKDEEFLLVLDAILSGEGTFRFWKDKVDSGSNDPEAYYQLAETYLNRDKNRLAIEYFKRAKEVAAGRQWPFSQEAELGIAFATGQDGKYRQAFGLLTEFCQRHPGSPLIPKAHFSIALTHFFSGKERTAENEFREVTRRYEDTPWGKKAYVMAEEMRAGRETKNQPSFQADWESMFIPENYGGEEQGKKKKKKK